MPNLNVYVLEGFSVEQKTQLLKRMSDVVASTLGAPLTSVRIFLIELPKAHVCIAGETLLDDELIGRPERAAGPTMHVFLIAGRSDAQKEALIGELTRAAIDTLGAPTEAVRVMIFDVANTDFGMSGVTAKSLGR